MIVQPVVEPMGRFTDEALLRHKPRDGWRHNLVLARDLLLGGRVHGRMVRTFSGLELFPSLAAHTAHTAADCRTLYRDICSKLHYLLKISKTVP